MNVYNIFSVLTFKAATIVAQVPTTTQIPPTVEVLDDEHILVDYSNSFSIPDFSKILTASVLDMDGIYRGSATKDYDKINDDTVVISDANAWV